MLDNGLADGQAQSGAALAPCVGGVGLREFVEKTRMILFRDARAMIDDRYPNRVPVRCRSDLDFAARIGVLRRVREEVGHDLQQAGPVS